MILASAAVAGAGAGGVAAAGAGARGSGGGIDTGTLAVAGGAVAAGALLAVVAGGGGDESTCTTRDIVAQSQGNLVVVDAQTDRRSELLPERRAAGRAGLPVNGTA